MFGDRYENRFKVCNFGKIYYKCLIFLIITDFLKSLIMLGLDILCIVYIL